MASLVVAGDVSGSVTLSAPSAAGSTVITLPTTSGTMVVTGGAQTVQFAAGSAASPSITFTGDTNTGIFSPTADTIAFSEGGVESMRIDSSGNVGIGTSSPGDRLVVRGAASVYGDERRLVQLVDTTALASGVGAGIAFYGVSESGGGVSQFGSIKGIKENATSANYAGALAFVTSNSSNVQTERMRITSGGNVLIGATSQGAAASGYMLGLQSGGTQTYLSLAKSGQTLDTSGLVIGIDPSSANIILRENLPLTFYTNATERMRITSSGYFKASNDGNYVSTSAVYHELRNTASDWVLYARNTAASNPYCMRANYSGAAPNNTGNQFLYCDDTSSLRAEIRSNGGLANYSANNSNLSDRREKTNFAPAKNYLDTICAIPVQTFNYIDQNLEEDDGLTLGVVAQDVQAVAPELVTESNWGTQEEPKMRLSIYQTDLQYALMKAIQELNAKVEAQAAEIAALKGAN